MHLQGGILRILLALKEHNFSFRFHETGAAQSPVRKNMTTNVTSLGAVTKLIATRGRFLPKQKCDRETRRASEASNSRTVEVDCGIIQHKKEENETSQV